MTIQAFYKQIITPGPSKREENTYYELLLTLTRLRLQQLRAVKLNDEWALW